MTNEDLFKKFEDLFLADAGGPTRRICTTQSASRAIPNTLLI